MRNLFYFLPVLTTRACVNKYGVPQIGGNYRSGSRSNVLQCRQTVQNESDEPCCSSFAAKRSKICSVTSSEISYIAGKEVDDTVVILFRYLYCRQYQTDQRLPPGGRFSPLILPTNRSGSAGDLGDATVFTGKQMKLTVLLRRVNLIKCRQRVATPGGNTYIKCRYPCRQYFRSCFADKEMWGQAPGPRSEVFYCRQRDQGTMRAAIFDLFSARNRSNGPCSRALITSFTADKQISTSTTSFFD